MNYAKKNNYAALYHDLTVLNSVVCHHGVKGQEWYKHKADRWQNHAMYAMGKPKFAEMAKERKDDESQQRRKNRSAKELVKDVLDKHGAEIISPAEAIRRNRDITEAARREGVPTFLGTPYKLREKYGRDSVSGIKAVKKGIPSIYDSAGKIEDLYERVVRTMPVLSGRDTSFHQTITLGPLAFKLGVQGNVYVNGISVFGVPRLAHQLTRISKGITEDIRRSKAPVDKDTGLHLKRKEGSLSDDALKCNPYYGALLARPNVNALKCITAMEMRSRGYDVAAKNRIFESYKKGNEHKIEQQFSGTKVTPIKDNTAIKSTLNKQPEGSRGVVFFNWMFTSASGHCFYYSVKNGKVIITDPQSGRVFNDINKLDKLFKSSAKPSYARLDNTKAVMEYIKEAVT